jgi:hypothetical protein
MTRISSRSKQQIIRLLVPPTDRTGIDDAAPRALTVRRLVHHRRSARLREHYTIAQTATGHLCCIRNLTHLGFDVIG